MKSNKKAFTLIELLVVIAIIGILATISVLALQNARAKSRDAKRAGDMKQIQTALELFFNDNSRYPTPADGPCTDNQNSIGYTPTDNYSSYTISFCLGGTTGVLDSGPKCLTPAGIIDVDCGSSTPAPLSQCGGDLSFSGFSNCGDTGTYCGSSYATVQVDGQCWMAGNLNVGSQVNSLNNSACVDITAGNGDYGWLSCQVDNGAFEKYCYDDNAANCLTYGGLYEWSEAMNFPYDCNDNTNIISGDGPYTYSCPVSGSHTIAAKHQGLCPTGWHIPSDVEWHSLEVSLSDDPANNCSADHGSGDCDTAGDKLKAVSVWGEDSLGNNSSGFTAVPGGKREVNANFTDLDNGACFWSSSSINGNGFMRCLFPTLSGVYRDNNSKVYAVSVRCLKD